MVNLQRQYEKKSCVSPCYGSARPLPEVMRSHNSARTMIRSPGWGTNETGKLGAPPVEWMTKGIGGRRASESCSLPAEFLSCQVRPSMWVGEPGGSPMQCKEDHPSSSPQWKGEGGKAHLRRTWGSRLTHGSSQMEPIGHSDPFLHPRVA